MLICKSQFRQTVNHTAVHDMQPSGTKDPALNDLLGDYAGHSGRDELLGPGQQPRPHWQALLALHLSECPTPVSPGPLGPPPVQAGELATSFLQPHSMCHVAVRDTLRALPEGRAFLQLALHAPLSAVLADTQLRLSLLAAPSPGSASAGGGGGRPELSLRSAALGSTVELLLSSVCTALQRTVPHHVLQLAERRQASVSKVPLDRAPGRARAGLVALPQPKGLPAPGSCTVRV